jgi:hypothetical protein
MGGGGKSVSNGRRNRAIPNEATQKAIRRAISIGWGGRGIEPPNGGIKISLIIQRFQCAFGKNPENPL